MSSPILHAFFVGRALAEAVNEQAEHLLTNSLSWLGQFDAEQREHLRQFTEEVLARAQQAEAAAGASPTSPAAASDLEGGVDLQATIDTLRAEVAQVRVALQQYRHNNSQS
jgi:demethoxyubiquinone hydroxylase (CLK1/Coq7/Cat5 family)